MLHWSREKDGRFYTAFICQDLLLDWVVVTAWGSKGRPKSQQMIITCTGIDDALEVLASVIRRRRARGYKLIEIDSIYGKFNFESANDQPKQITRKPEFYAEEH